MQVYLDNGATTKLDESVLEEMRPCFDIKYGNASSLHKFGREARSAIDKSRKVIADSINAEPDEIIFTSGGTESNNLALKGIAFANKHRGDHIIISKIEHDCVLNASRWLSKNGFNVTMLDVDKYGIVDPQALKKAITNRTILVSIMHANNEIGTVLPIEEYGSICREKNVLFHTDACQSYTKIPIDVKSMNIDLMTLNAHKIHGPKGVGCLFIRKGIKITPIAHGGGHEFNLRSGTENVPGIVGFAKASALHKKQDIQKMTELRDYLIKRLLKIPETQLNGHPEKRLCNNASISFHFIEGESLLMHLDMQGIAVSTGSACSSHSLEPSHVLLAIGLKHEIAHGTIRFTLSKYTTKQEIDYTISKVNEIVNKLREISPLKKGMKYTKEYKDEHHHSHDEETGHHPVF
ncbi:cysteine desulfurase NifS [Candidatus Woesearchaeota archaeon]|nr:cysteine desulfurase NifS [Candidatus Woesearchaeota archaeon]